MTDFKVLVVEHEGIDLDFQKGEAVYLDEAAQTGDQRAALAVYAAKGTVPGAEDYGVSWGEEYSQQNSVVTISNEVQQQLQSQAGAADTDSFTVQNQYQGIMTADSGNLGVIVLRG